MKVNAGLGASVMRDSYEAGKEAASAAMDELKGESPALVLVFTTPQYELRELLSGIRSVTGSTPLAGGTTAGEIIRDRYMGFGEGVTVTVLSAGPYHYGVASAANINNDLTRAGQEIARNSRAEAGESDYSGLILIADCLSGDLQKLFYGAYKITGPATAIVGGAASDEMQFKETFVFHNDKVIEKGAVAVWISSDKPLKIVTRHGWAPMGIPLLVTRAEGTEIMELGGRPAAAAYEEQIGAVPGQLTSENFWDTSMYHPFGVMQMDGSSIIRVARNKTQDDSLLIQACVPPPGSSVQVMEGNDDSLLSIAEEVGYEAVADSPEAGLIIAFSCAMRPKIFKERTPEEAKLLQEAAGNVPVVGMYCCGEFARTAGTLGTHNATLTVLAL